jgi:hypothetical protein
MLRIASVVLAGVVVVVAAACPAVKEKATEVGGAPHAQVDLAKERVDRAEKKLEENAAAAAAVTE